MMGFAAGNAQHIGAREEQQDAFGFSDPSDKGFVAHGGLLGVVADGMGGLANGQEASLAAVRTFLSAYQDKSPREPIADALLRSLNEANRAVVQLANRVRSKDGVGSTLVAAVLHQNSLYWISAGDSRIYLLRGNRLTQLTADHTYGKQLNQQVAQGKISLAAAKGDAERGSLTSYLGDPVVKEVDRNLRPFPVNAGDVVVACSDGLYRALNDQEMAAVLGDDLQDACEALIQQAVAKGRPQQDNLTVVAMKYPSNGKGDRRRKRTRVLLLVLIGLLLSIAAAYWYRDRAARRDGAYPLQETETIRGGGDHEPAADKDANGQKPPPDTGNGNNLTGQGVLKENQSTTVKSSRPETSRAKPKRTHPAKPREHGGSNQEKNETNPPPVAQPVDPEAIPNPAQPKEDSPPETPPGSAFIQTSRRAFSLERFVASVGLVSGARAEERHGESSCCS